MRHRSMAVASALWTLGVCACGPVQLNVPEGGASTLPIDGATATESCDNAALQAGCTTMGGVCTVSAPSNPLPNGASLLVSELPLPADLQADSLRPSLCSITLPSGVTSLPDLSLSIRLDAPPASPAVLFQRLAANVSELVLTSEASDSAVAGLVTAPGDFGATARPGVWDLKTSVGIAVSSAADQASLLQNLSSQPVNAAFYDGTHLFVCNGPRLVVYNALPSSPAVAPDVVLGQPDLDTTSAQTTASLFGAQGCGALWSDGTRLVAGSANRILIWNRIPTTDAAPADLVLGQSNFDSNKPNAGGNVSASSLSSVASVDSDGTRLAAAEISNNRILVWNRFPQSIDQPADVVIGQPDFTTSTAYAGATPINQAWGSVFASGGLFVTGMFSPGLVHVADTQTSNPTPDFTALPLGSGLQSSSILYQACRVSRTPNGGLAVRDYGLQRVAVLSAVPSGPAAISFVLGQPDPAYVVANPVSASAVAPVPAEQGLGGGQLLMVPESNRLLVYDTPPSYNFEPASRVIGQPGFTTNGKVDYHDIGPATLANPADVAVGQGTVAIADRSNNRVVLYRKTDIAAGQLSAAVVLGQPDASSYVPNLDQRTPNASRLSGPSGVAIDGTRLIVADSENHRVLVWNTLPAATGTPADLVLGQADFGGHRPNRGRGDADGDGFSDAAADGFFYPTGVASDGTHLFVVDRLNNRVLGWTTFPTVNGQPADTVLGQPDFSTTRANRGGGGFAIAADGLNLPTGVALVGTALWVADTENNRVVRYDDAFGAPMPSAFVGQASGQSVANPNYAPVGVPNVGIATTPATAAASVLRPRGVAVVGGNLYVSETSSNRVHVFDLASLSPLADLGQSSDTQSTGNAGGVSASSLSTPTGLAADGTQLWVADSDNSRVVGYDVTRTPTTGTAATTVLGQANFLSNGFNQASAAGNGVTSRPGGVALSNGLLYVADAGNNRVLVFSTPVASGQTPSRVYGEPDMLQALANAGGAASGSTLASPQGVFVDALHLVVADSGNHRVLVFDPNAATAGATLVLGQADFAGSSPNAGGVSAASMSGPTAAFSDGTSLWVADTGNHRVLVWNTFPTTNGQPADAVLGQASFTGDLPNRGGAAATAASLSFPSSVDVVGGALYVADAGNNRVVWYPAGSLSSGMNATGVLGQADLVSRAPATTSNDFSHLAGPVALADDGANLYVSDRDLSRVQIYSVGTLANGVSASSSVGSLGGLTLKGPAGIVAERTPLFTSRLYIADTGDNAVAVVEDVNRLTIVP